MTKDEIQKVLDALQPGFWGVHQAKQEALAILNRELAKPDQKPIGMVTVYPKGGAASCCVEMEGEMPEAGLYMLYVGEKL